MTCTMLRIRFVVVLSVNSVLTPASVKLIVTTGGRVPVCFQTQMVISGL